MRLQPPATRISMSTRYLYIGMLLAVAGLGSANAAAAATESTVNAGPVKATVRVDRDSAQVAEPVRLTLTVEAPQGTRVELPQLGKELGAFALSNVERTKDIPAGADGKLRQWSLSTLLDTIKTGVVEVPAIEVHYTTASKTTDAKATTFETLATKPLSIEVKSVLENRADPTKFRDIAGTVDVALPQSHSYAWLGWTAASVGGAAAIALAALAVAKRRRGPTAAAWALASIEDLRKLPITTSEDAEAAYNEVVDVLREYFELAFNIPVLARTTREFLTESTKYVKLEKSSRERLASLAAIADEIKFARLGVGESQVRQALDQAEAFVQECEAAQRAAAKEAA